MYNQNKRRISEKYTEAVFYVFIKMRILSSSFVLRRTVLHMLHSICQPSKPQRILCILAE